MKDRLDEVLRVTFRLITSTCDILLYPRQVGVSFDALRDGRSRVQVALTLVLFLQRGHRRPAPLQVQASTGSRFRPNLHFERGSARRYSYFSLISFCGN